MEKISSRNPNFRSRALRWVAPCAALWALASCGIYSTDRFDVSCDASLTVADLKGDTSRTAFYSDGKDGDRVVIGISKNGQEYSYFANTIGPDGGEPLEVVGNVTTDGSADYDYFVTNGDTEWIVDVRPDDGTVVLNGRC